MAKSARGFFFVTLAAAILGLGVSAGTHAPGHGGGLFGFVAGSVFAFGLGDWLSARLRHAPIAGSARAAAMAGLAVASYFWAFHWPWTTGSVWDPSQHTFWWVVPTLAFAVAGAALGARELPAMARTRTGQGNLATMALLAGAGILGMILPRGMMEVVGPIAANVAALAVGALWLASGFADADRRHFWFGTVFLIAVVLSRFVEFDTNLMTKGCAFLAAGVVVIYGGIEYERFLRRRAAAPEVPHVG